MDPEIQQQINDQLNEMSELLRQQNSYMANQVKMMNSVSASMTNQATAANSSAKAGKDAATATGNSTKLSEITSNANKLQVEAMNRLSSSFETGKKSLLGFTQAMLDVTPGMAKYSESIKGGIDSVGNFAAGFGPLGAASSGLLKVFSQLVTASFNYVDAIVKGYDDVAKLGGGIGTTAEEIAQLGQQAGLSSGTLEIFTKNAGSLGSNIRALGATTSDGVKNFGKFIAVGDQTLQQYRKLGYSQEQLVEAQTKYLDLQAKSGADLRRSPEQLQKASLKYLDSLNVLAELTGNSVEEQQAALDAVLAQENFNAYIFNMEQEKAKALKEGNTAEAARIEKVIEAKTNMAKFAQANLDAESATAVMESIATNGKTIYTENNAKLLMNGIKIDEMNDQTNQGIDQTARLAGENAKAVERFQKNFGEMGYAAGKSSRELQETFGIGNKARAAAAKFSDLKTEEGQKQWYKEKAQLEAEQEAKKNETAGVVAQRAAVESNERAARLAFDQLLKQMSDMLMNLALKIMPHIVTAISFVSNNFDKIVSVSKGLAIAMGALAAAAAVGKIVNVFRGLGDSVKGLFGKKEGPAGSSSDNPMYVKTAGAAGALGDLVGDSSGGGKGGGGGKGDGAMDKLSSASSAGGKSSGFLMSVVRALAYAGRAAQYIVLGAGAVGAAIALVGAGIAGATWIIGGALPNLAKGLKSFDKLDGPNLKQVGIGMAGLGAGILAMGAGKVAGAVGNLINFFVDGEDPIEKVSSQVFKLQELDIDKKKVENNSAALVAFSKAMASASAIGAAGSIAGVASAMADGVSSFFSDKPPFQDFVDFSHLNINAKKTKNNAVAFKYFSEAMASYEGLASPIGAIGTALAEAAAKFFGVKPPLGQFVSFSHLNIDAKKTSSNAKAFISFANAMAEYKGGPGLLDTVSSLIGKGFNALFDQDGPVEAFAKFAAKDFGPKAKDNAEAFKKYAEASGMLSGNSTSGSSPSGSSPSGSSPSGFSGAVQSGLETGAAVGAGAVGLVGGAIAGGAGLVYNAVDWAKARITGKPTEVLNFTARSGSYANFTALDPDMQKAVIMAATDYKKATGRKMQMNSGRRAVADQERLWAETVRLGTPGKGPQGMLVGKPPRLGGNPPHLRGNAIDLQEAKSDPSRALPILARYGLKQTYGKKDAVHVDLMRARDGGLFDGPGKSYPSAMKMMSSLDTESIVMKLAKTPASAAKNDKKKDAPDKNVAAIYSQNSQLTFEISKKLDQVIDALENDNSVQNKILKHSRA